MKRLLLTLLALALLFSLAACQSKEYKNNVDPDDLLEDTIEKIDRDNDYVEVLDGFYDDYFKIPSYVTESETHIAAISNNINEFGIFQVTSGKAGEMKTILETYLADALRNNEAWYDSYIPLETPKLRDAEVKVFGNYVVYAVASAEHRAAFFKEIEDALIVK